MSTKAKFVRLTIAQFEALMRAGQMCSNVCFNLAQDRAISETHRAAMDESRRTWDKAASEARKDEG